MRLRNFLNRCEDGTFLCPAAEAQGREVFILKS
jgi:hypothetical protein